ncbi:hypothetical protein [Roseibium marinum]|uniref:Tetratricopeptide repeat protein n=1 Tax=Roseibium marinum TaxID=281252 RepID=A0A2S3V2B8_9HYPH|nr:hypothetical protein [Roseibium marinum]POF33829.1 hypothetical protein CLV41_101278 [Roseibium marinum]
MTDLHLEPDPIDFGALPDAVNTLLQQGVRAYRHDHTEADRLFRQALDAAPSELPVYFCLYKIHTYQGHLDQALAAAEGGLAEAARQAGWDLDWRQWSSAPLASKGPGRFALYTLKALAFIHLRKDDIQMALEMLAALKKLDPTGSTGWPVISALAAGLGTPAPEVAGTSGIPLA